ncbi:MAG TPA: hypothetical protein VHK88_19905 [Aquihabitans sp.]|jgi:hypothetical protein|nr:hypothetical protein [Aquihabitans sp.]
MAHEAVALLLNPSDTSKGYIVWSHGEVAPFGGAPPTDAEIMFTNLVIGGQILDWTTPSGAVFLADGAVVPFGGAAWSEPATLTAFPIVRAMHANPAGTNQGYRMLADGTIQKWGVGTPNPTYVPTTSGTNLVRDWAFEWGTQRSLILRADGTMQTSTGVTGSTVVVKPGRDVYRSLAIREWDATPGFWVADYAGTIYKGNGAEDPGLAGPKWYGRDIVRDLAVVDDGLGGDPLTLAVLTSYGSIGRFTISDPPVVDVVAPTGTITTTTRPQIRWTYTDPDGDAQAAYHARLFTSAQYGIGGFDAATSPATAEWYGVDRTVFAIDPTTDLANGTWRAYVRSRDTAGQLSAWDYIQFTQNVTPPATPTVAAVLASNWAVTVTTSNANIFGSVDVEFTDDPPTATTRTWDTVRGSGVFPNGSGVLVLTDREARLNVPRYYRARSRVSGPTVVSAWSTSTVTVTVTEAARWLLSAPTETGAPIAVDIDPGFSWSEPLAAGIVRPPGRAEAIVVRGAGGRQSAEGQATIRTLTAAARIALRYLIDGTRTLLLRSPYGEHWYCEVTGDVGTSMMDGLAPTAGETTEMRHAHETTVTFTQTSRP